MRLGSFLLLMMGIVSFAACDFSSDCHLPHLGQHEVVVNDTIYYTIPKFVGLVNQDSQVMGFKQLEGKIYIAEFFQFMQKHLSLDDLSNGENTGCDPTRTLGRKGEFAFSYGRSKA